jgi:hypothetical protein
MEDNLLIIIEAYYAVSRMYSISVFILIIGLINLALNFT